MQDRPIRITMLAVIILFYSVIRNTDTSPLVGQTNFSFERDKISANGKSIIASLRNIRISNLTCNNEHKFPALMKMAESSSRGMYGVGNRRVSWKTGLDLCLHQWQPQDDGPKYRLP